MKFETKFNRVISTMLFGVMLGSCTVSKTYGISQVRQQQVSKFESVLSSEKLEDIEVQGFYAEALAAVFEREKELIQSGDMESIQLRSQMLYLRVEQNIVVVIFGKSRSVNRKLVISEMRQFYEEFPISKRIYFYDIGKRRLLKENEHLPFPLTAEDSNTNLIKPSQ